MRRLFYYGGCGDLILAVAVEQQYPWNPASGAFSFDKPKLTRRTEYYFTGDRLLYVRYRLFQPPEESAEEQKTGRQLLLDAKLFLAAAKSKRRIFSVEDQVSNH